ncbi:MAG: RDD family protein [Verrucomicrobiales bacterium]|nr:RDD family protein [Verrucomicrobiales bacterium]
MERFLIKWKGRQTGPFSEAELREMLANREVKSLHEVQVAGEWKTLRSFFKERDKIGEDFVPEDAPPPQPEVLVEISPSPPSVQSDAVLPRTDSFSSSIPPALPVGEESAVVEPMPKKDVTIALGQETEGALGASVELKALPTEKKEPTKKEEEKSQEKPAEKSLPESIAPKGPAPDIAHEVVLQTRAGEFLVYAGFWNRFLAATVDGVIVYGAPLWILGKIFRMNLIPWEPVGSLSEILSLGGLGIALLVLAFVYIWIYFASMESSRKRATLGKQIFGLVVTTEKGERVSFQRASKRFFGKILSALMIFAGFFLAAFTRKKQAFHDILSDSTVNFSFPSYRLLKRRETKPHYR